MRMIGRLMSYIFKLPPAETYDIAVEKDLKIPMSDGIILLANHYYPRNLGSRPTILVQSVYTNRTKGAWECEVLAQRGFQVLVVSGRGACGSDGELNPFLSERRDGIFILQWIKKQKWFNGELGTYGGSYLGYTQWAVAHDAGTMLKAMASHLVGSNFRSFLYPGNAFSLEIFIAWMDMVNSQEKSMLGNIINSLGGNKRRRRAALHLPLGEIDRVVTGKNYKFWQDWIAHEQVEDPYWESGNHSGTVLDITAPNHLLGGWYDFMLPQMLRDYTVLKNSGRHPYLTVGPWSHFSMEAAANSMRQSIIWLRAQLLGDRGGLRELPVRIFVMGAKEWREYSSWPPDDIKYKRIYLQSGGGLADHLPTQSKPDCYSYDPNDPTPTVGGALRTFGQGNFVQDNRSLESRTDVLTYTSTVLNDDIDVIGPVSAEIFVHSNLKHTDFFVRLCDVEPSGKSLNVCDGLLRLAPGHPEPESDGCLKITIELWSTAYRFRHGHRIRIQVVSGSFPAVNRNSGTGEQIADITTMKIAQQSIYHDPDHPSSIILPFVD